MVGLLWLVYDGRGRNSITGVDIYQHLSHSGVCMDTSLLIKLIIREAHQMEEKGPVKNTCRRSILCHYN